MKSTIYNAILNLYVLLEKANKTERDIIEKNVANYVNKKHLPCSNLTLKDFNYFPLNDQFTSIVPQLYALNKTLESRQKQLVLVETLSMFEKTPNAAEWELIEICSEIFSINKEILLTIKTFIFQTDITLFNSPNFLIIGDLPTPPNSKKIVKKLDDSFFVVLKLPVQNLYFFKFLGSLKVALNDTLIKANQSYLINEGGILFFPQKNKNLYFSQIFEAYKGASQINPFSFNVSNIQHRFKDGNIGVQTTSFTAQSGNLIAIMGGSGVGKTTLLNILSGAETATSGEVKINGLKIQQAKLEGLIGYVYQDDLLIEELTVFENMYYNAKLIYGNTRKEKLNILIYRTLKRLGLFNLLHSKVGSIHDKTLSGGQRKRLNIALELIRKPEVLFVDEPTSGLSSKDSENVIHLLKELSLQGHLVFVIIHQPSSKIFRLFDKLLIMDKGGYQIYYGSNGSVYSHFLNYYKTKKTIPKQPVFDADQLFDLIEELKTDNYGSSTDQRKVSAREWNNYFLSTTTNQKTIETSITSNLSHKNSVKPHVVSQFITYLKRNTKTKISNKQFILINLLETPVLAFILSFIIRRVPGTDTEYFFSANENIPAYIFMSIIVVFFIGITISAEEIFKDRNILIRESFLNLSWGSFVTSKAVFLTLISAFHSLVFVFITNNILKIEGQIFPYWLMLFTIMCNASLLGLNLSASFNSAVSIYILIPLLVIPQMILGGAMFSYDKLNKIIDNTGYAPIVAAIIPSRWAYEGLMVNQFKENQYSKLSYKYDQKLSLCRYKQGAYLTELYHYSERIIKQLREQKKVSESDIHLIKNELNKEFSTLKFGTVSQKKTIANLSTETINLKTANNIKEILHSLSNEYQNILNSAAYKKETLFKKISANHKDSQYMIKIKHKYFNNRINTVVTRRLNRDNLKEKNNELIRLYEPVYCENKNNLLTGNLFFISIKNIFGIHLSTMNYNLIIIWLSNFILFLSLKYNWLKNIINFTH